MSELSDQNESESRPPIFGSWRGVYWFVAGFFVVEVAVFYLISCYYS